MCAAVESRTSMIRDQIVTGTLECYDKNSNIVWTHSHVDFEGI